MGRAFNRLLWAEAINRFGDGFFSIGVSWIIYTHTHSVLPLGFLWAGYMLVVGGLQSALAPVADAADRRKLLVGVNVARGAIVLAPAVLGLFGLYRVFELYPAFVLLGIAGLPARSAVSAMTPALVPEGQLVTANARLQGVSEAMYLIGPAVAGLVLYTLGARSGLLIDGGSFVVAAALIETLPPLGQGRSAGDEPYWASWAGGARAVFSNRRLWLLAALAVLAQFTDVAFIVLSVPLVRSVLDGTTRGVGFLEASLSGGYLVGAFLMDRAARRIHPGLRGRLVLVFCLATAGIALIPALWWALLTQAVGGIADAIFQVEWQATFQAGVEERRLGGVFMWQAGAQSAAAAVGALLAAGMAVAAGIPAAFAVIGLLGAVLAAVVLMALARLPQGAPV